jgi:alanine dehydrogenase
MNIGVLKEIKPNELRVALVPAGVQALTQDGHSVSVETNAGAGRPPGWCAARTCHGCR